MRTLRSLLAGIRGLFGRTDPSGDIADELRDFEVRHTAELLERGVPVAEAERQGKALVGSIPARTEQVRSAAWETGIETIFRDARYACRMLRRNPGFTITALVTLALGLGVNASISSLYAGIVLRPVPIADPDLVVRLLRTSDTGTDTAFSHPQFRHYQDRGLTSSTLVATSDAVVVLSTATGSERSAARLVSGEYFKVAPAVAIAGRSLGPADTAGVVLNERVWRRHFAGQPLHSHTVALNGVPFPVIGVLRGDAPGPSFEAVPDVWVPLAAHALLNPGSTLWNDDAVRWLSIYARLSDVSTGPHVSNALTAVDRDRGAAEFASSRITLVPSARRSVEEQGRLAGASATATAAGMVVTLIACLNLAALLLSRSVQRQHEFALRGAIGASTGRLVAQLLVESLVLAFAAAVLGLAAAWASAPLVRDLSGAPAWMNAAPDWRIAAWSFAVAGAAGVLVCVFPIIQIVRRGRCSTGFSSVSPAGTGSALRRWLVGIEVCGATVLLVVAVLLTRGVARAHEMPFGFAVDNVLGVSLDLRAHGIPLAQAGVLGQQIEDRLERIPGVQSVARTQFVPLDSSGTRSVTRDGAAFVTLNHHYVGADYFGTLGIDVLWGRTFTAAEMTSTLPVAVINERLARKLGSPQDLLGTSLGRAHHDLADVVIVGITRDALVSDPRDTTAVYVYRPLRARAALDTNFVVRTAGAADLWTSRAEHAIRLANPELRPLVGGVANRLSTWVDPARAGARAAAIVALLAVTLSLVGVYGVSAFSVRQRTREIGVRLALGATPRRLVWQFAAGNIRPLAVGSVIGLFLSLAASGLVQGLLFGLDPLDLPTFLGAIGLFWLPALLAVMAAVRRAGQVDPAITLRAE